jgi:hypothetical protein
MDHLRKFAIAFAACGFSVRLALGATCHTDKPFILSEPAEAITALLHSRVEHICNGGYPSFPPSANDNIWNLNELNFRIRRPDTNADLSVCTHALDDIINQCIAHQLWGGQYDWAGSIYSIENGVGIINLNKYYDADYLKVYGTDVPPVRLVDFVTWAMQETAQYKQNETEENRKDASDVVKLAAACKSFSLALDVSALGSYSGNISTDVWLSLVATAGMAPAAAIAALEAAANAQSAAEMEQRLKEADDASDGTLTSTSSSTPSSTTSSAQPSATYNFVKACSGSDFQ